MLSVFVMTKLKEAQRWVVARAAGQVRGIKFGSYRALLVNSKVEQERVARAFVACSAGIIGLWGIGNFHPKIVGDIVARGATRRARADRRGARRRKRPTGRRPGLLLQNIGGFLGMLSPSRNSRRRRGPPPGLRTRAAAVVPLDGARLQVCMRERDQMYWMLPIMGFGQLSVFGVYAIYLPELFPTSLRSTGTSFCYNFGRLLAATAPFTISRFYIRLGGDIEAFRTAGLWMSLVLLIGIAVLPFLPETKDRPLPEE